MSTRLRLFAQRNYYLLPAVWFMAGFSRSFPSAAMRMMLVNEKLICSFRILRPAAHKKYYENTGATPGA